MGKVKSWDGGFGIGRPTMRGVRKCPKCGVISGIRRNACKNKSCNAIFREDVAKKKESPEACQLHTGTTTRVYSVRMRDKGPDYRGFVQLPMNQEKEEFQNSLCFVDLCQGNFKSKILLCHEQDKRQGNVICNHIKAAMNCSIKAVPLTVNTAVLDVLNIEQDVKEELWGVLRECAGPAVQRISRNVMAVKCRASPKYPLGYLHFSFGSARSEHELQFSCPCSTFKESAKNGVRAGRCAHFYACICAFVEDENLRQEFQHYIRLEIFLEIPSAKESSVIENAEEEIQGDRAFASLLEDAGCRVEVLQEDFSSILSETIADDVTNILSETTEIVFPKINETIEELTIPVDCSEKIESSTSVLNLNTIKNREITARPTILKMDKKSKAVKINFLEWLGSVIETMNQQLKHESKNSVTLDFSVPHKFFNIFYERIRVLKNKNAAAVVAILNREGFSTPFYSWSFGNRRQIKELFDTPLIKLKLSKTLICDSDGIYKGAKLDQELKDRSVFKAFISVKVDMPLRVEWTPGVLPISQIGEMKIIYNIGHFYNKIHN